MSDISYTFLPIEEFKERALKADYLFLYAVLDFDQAAHVTGCAPFWREYVPLDKSFFFFLKNRMLGYTHAVIGATGTETSSPNIYLHGFTNNPEKYNQSKS